MPLIALVNSNLEIITALLPDTFRNNLRENTMIYFSQSALQIYFGVPFTFVSLSTGLAGLPLVLGQFQAVTAGFCTHVPVCIFISVA